MIELNLLPDVKREYIQAQLLKRNIIAISILAILISIGVIILLAFYVHVVQAVAQDNVVKDINKSNQQLNAIPQLSKILTVQDALTSLPSLKSQQPINSRMFTYLPVLLPAQVSLNKLDIEQSSQTMTIEGVSQDYTSLNVFADDLKDAQLTYGLTNDRIQIEPFSKVVITSADESDDAQAPGVDFTITLSFNPIMFTENTNNPVMSVPNVNPNQQYAQSGKIFGGNGQ